MNSFKVETAQQEMALYTVRNEINSLLDAIKSVEDSFRRLSNKLERGYSTYSSDLSANALLEVATRRQALESAVNMAIALGLDDRTLVPFQQAVVAGSLEGIEVI